MECGRLPGRGHWCGRFENLFEAVGTAVVRLLQQALQLQRLTAWPTAWPMLGSGTMMEICPKMHQMIVINDFNLMHHDPSS